MPYYVYPSQPGMQYMQYTYGYYPQYAAAPGAVQYQGKRVERARSLPPPAGGMSCREL